MADHGRSRAYSELLESATGLIDRSGAVEAARSFGIDDLLADRHLDRDGEEAVLAFLEAQGRRGDVPASSVLSRFAMAHPALTDHGGLLFAEATPDTSRAVVAGWREGDVIAVDVVDAGLVALPRVVAVPGPPALADVEYVVTVDTEPSDRDLLLSAHEFAQIRPSVLSRLRIGAAVEMLGSCTRMIEDAIDYTQKREQFGRALADFAPVQNILAWAAAEQFQLRALIDAAIAGHCPPDLQLMHATVAKSLAGRVARAVSQHTLQVTGGIGFTWEHHHHRLHRRTLALDAVGGSGVQLATQLGASLRLTGELPDLVTL